MAFERWKDPYIPQEPGERFRIAILYQVASFWPCIESFYGECVKDGEVDVRIFFIGAVSVEKAQVEGSDAFLAERGIPFSVYSEQEIRAFLPHVALYQTPYDVSFRNPDALAIHLKRMGIRIAYIPYGIEIADTEDARLNHFHTFVVKNAWRIYTFSERMQEDYRRYCPNRLAVRALGIPKFDALAHKEQVDTGKIRKAAEGRRVVLWKMHFPKLIYEDGRQKQVTPYLKEYRKFVERIEQYEDSFFVVMPHPVFFSETIDRRLAEEGRQLLGDLAQKKNVLIDRSPDYRTALYSADAVIIDRSAVMVEAGFLDVPVLYMKNADYEEPLTQAVKTLVDAYEQGTTGEDICRFLEKLPEMGTELTGKIRAVSRVLAPYKMGECGKRILEDMKEGIAQDGEDKIRIAFFGASFICEHYIHILKIRDNPDFEVVCLSDNDEKKWGTLKAGIEVVAPDKLQKMDLDMIVIASENYYMRIKKQLIYDLWLAEEKILPLDVFAEEYCSIYHM